MAKSIRSKSKKKARAIQRKIIGIPLTKERLHGSLRVLKRSCELQGAPTDRLDCTFSGVEKAKPVVARFTFNEKPEVDYAAIAPQSVCEMPMLPPSVPSVSYKALHKKHRKRKLKHYRQKNGRLERPEHE